MQSSEIFPCTCLALALNRRDVSILETMLSEDAVFRNHEQNLQIEGKEAILAFCRIWFHTLNISLEAGSASFNAELAKIHLKGNFQICLLIRRNIRGATLRYLSICRTGDGLIRTIDLLAFQPGSIEELNIFPY